MSTTPAKSTRGLSAIILAAGKGTRMNSDLPKVVHPIGGRAMVCAVVDACIEAGVDHIVVVVGHRKQDVIAALRPYVGTASLRLEFANQDVQSGTGHAVQQARPAFEPIMLGRAPARDVFVLCGDGPLIRAKTLDAMLARHRSTGAAATLATSVIPDATGYGRIVRDASGRFERIVEHKGATEAQRSIREVNPSYYLFDTRALFDSVARVEPNAASGEYYITDVFQIMLASGQRVEVIDAVPPEDVLSINTPEQLAEVDAIFRSRAPAGAPGGRRPGGASLVRGGGASGKGADS